MSNKDKALRIAQSLKAARKAHEITQADCSAYLKIDQATFCRWEQGCTVTLLQLLDWCDAVGAEVREVVA